MRCRLVAVDVGAQTECLRCKCTDVAADVNVQGARTTKERRCEDFCRVPLRLKAIAFCVVLEIVTSLLRRSPGACQCVRRCWPWWRNAYERIGEGVVSDQPKDSTMNNKGRRDHVIERWTPEATAYGGALSCSPERASSSFLVFVSSPQDHSGGVRGTWVSAGYSGSTYE